MSTEDNFAEVEASTSPGRTTRKESSRCQVVAGTDCYAASANLPRQKHIISYAVTYHGPGKASYCSYERLRWVLCTVLTSGAIVRLQPDLWRGFLCSGLLDVVDRLEY